MEPLLPLPAAASFPPVGKLRMVPFFFLSPSGVAVPDLAVPLEGMEDSTILPSLRCGVPLQQMSVSPVFLVFGFYQLVLMRFSDAHSLF